MHFGDGEQIMRHIRVDTEGREDKNSGFHRLEGNEILHDSTIGDLPKNKCACRNSFDINRVEKHPFRGVQDESLYICSEHDMLIRVG
jgi:hypothetical protein